MRRFARLILASLALAGAAPQAMAQPAFITRTTPLPDTGAIPLPAPAGASSATEIWDMFGPGNPMVRDVTQPTLTPVLPDTGKATGAAAIVAPGGAFLGLSMETEGFAVARQLAARGIAAFVLKYRVDPSPPAESELMAFAAPRFEHPPRDAAAATRERHADAEADALAALRLIRSRAGEWHIDPRRVGIIGFSAGAITAMGLAQSAPAGEGPAFVGYIYGPQAVDTAPADAPPLFDALAMDDQLFHATDFPVVAAWLAAKRPVELHVYGRGGHGFGLGKPGQTTSLLMDEFTAWLGMQGFLARKDGM